MYVVKKDKTIFTLESEDRSKSLFLIRFNKNAVQARKIEFTCSQAC